MPASQPVEMNFETYEKCLKAFFELYERNKCIITIKTRGPKISTRVEVDDIIGDEVLEQYGLSSKDFSDAIKIITSSIMAIINGEVDKLIKWIENKEVYIIDDIHSFIELTNDYVNKTPKLAENFNFKLNTISNIFTSIDYRLQVNFSKDKNQKISSCKLLLNYLENYSEESNEKSLVLDLCLADIDYLISTLDDIKNEIQEID